MRILARISEESYDSIKPGYYHHAMLHGGNLVRFWHRNKFRKAIECVGSFKGKKILDLGCGPGSLISLLPEGYQRAVGVDFSRRQIEFAKRNFRSKKIDWVNRRIEDARFDKGNFDVIFMIEVLEHIPMEKNRRIFAKIFGLLKKKGKFVMTTPNYRSLWPIIEFFWSRMKPVDYREQHINRFDIPKIKSELESAGFINIRIKTIFFVSPFFGILFPKLAERMMDIEEKLFPGLGALIVAEAEKK